MLDFVSSRLPLTRWGILTPAGCPPGDSLLVHLTARSWHCSCPHALQACRSISPSRIKLHRQLGFKRALRKSNKSTVGASQATYSWYNLIQPTNICFLCIYIYTVSCRLIWSYICHQFHIHTYLVHAVQLMFKNIHLCIQHFGKTDFCNMSE